MHTPVLLKEAVEMLGAGPGKSIIDATFGEGGHTKALLATGARVLAIDRDINQVESRKSKVESLAQNTKVFLDSSPGIVVADVSFISLTQILPTISRLVTKDSQLIMMCKPQFEAGKGQTNKGIIKNSAVRRKILNDFENWLGQNNFLILDKADSHVSGTKGNTERFYKLKSL